MCTRRVSRLQATPSLEDAARLCKGGETRGGGPAPRQEVVATLQSMFSWWTSRLRHIPGSSMSRLAAPGQALHGSAPKLQQRNGRCNYILENCSTRVQDTKDSQIQHLILVHEAWKLLVPWHSPGHANVISKCPEAISAITQIGSSLF